MPDQIPASQAAFLDDVERTLRAWRRAPLLPVLTLAVAGVGLLGSTGIPSLAALGSVLGLLLVGWPGVERLWYLRLWTGRSLTPGEAVAATLRCFGRFFVLGLVVFAAFGVLGLPAIIGFLRTVEFASDGTPTFPDRLPVWVAVYSLLLGLAGYVLLTFVTPAIVYSSKRVRDAIPIGLRLLRVSWPRTAAYALVPALLTSIPWLSFSLQDFQTANPVGALFGALVLLLGRGAVAAYYLRTVPGAGPDGAVQLAPQPGYYPPPQKW